MFIIASFGLKGGIGKTTSVINYAAAFSFLGKNTLIIDVDDNAAINKILTPQDQALKTELFITDLLLDRFQERFKLSLTNKIAKEIVAIIESGKAEVFDDFMITQCTHRLTYMDLEMLVVYSSTNKNIITFMPKHYSVFEVHKPKQKKLKPEIKKFKSKKSRTLEKRMANNQKKK